eukprot:scaffold17.g547.t1
MASCAAGQLPAATHGGRRPAAFSPARPPHHAHRHRPRAVRAQAAVAAPPRPAIDSKRPAEGHTALLQGLGEVGDVSPSHMPWLLRLAHVKSTHSGGDSAAALQESARGLLLWKAALERGLVLDDATIAQLTHERDSFVAGQEVAALRWPEEPLRGVLVRGLSRLGVARFAAKYPAVLDALLRGLLELVCKYHKAVAGEVDVEQRETDTYGNTAAELRAEEIARRGQLASSANVVRPPPGAAAAAQQAGAADSETEEEEEEDGRADWSIERRTAEELVAALVQQWRKPIDTLSKAGKAFEGLESLLGGAGFDLGGSIWGRKGWADMDNMRQKLEDVKELRDLVRSLGRGGGWGPLRRAPIQYLDMKGRPGLLRTVLEAQASAAALGGGQPRGAATRPGRPRVRPGGLSCPPAHAAGSGRMLRSRRATLPPSRRPQETRGLTRSDDISRLLPSEAATLARGRQARTAARAATPPPPRPCGARPLLVRQSKLLFYAKLAEKALQCYERDGWGEFPTQIIPERREVRPTADRGPILLCVDTSGSMRGAREVVAKALALECMRAAKAQERGCYVFAFAGPQEVRELELNMDVRSVNNLLDFLEKTFNGGSDFNAPVQRCLNRLTDAKWANSDILLASSCAPGNAARREAGLRLERMRQAEIKRRRLEQRGDKKANAKAVRMPGKDAASFDV